MTPDERRNARKAIDGFFAVGPSSVSKGFLVVHLRIALNQLDADERRRKDDEALMRQALNAALLALNHTPHMCKRWQIFAETIDALRARLAPAPEPKP